MPDFASEEFLTVQEVADLLKLNQQTVRNWIDAGTLPAVHVGRRVRILRSDFDDLVESGYSRSPPAEQHTSADAFWSGDDIPGADGTDAAIDGP